MSHYAVIVQMMAQHEPLATVALLLFLVREIIPRSMSHRQIHKALNKGAQHGPRE